MKNLYLLFLAAFPLVAHAQVSIIPQPVRMTVGTGSFEIDRYTGIDYGANKKLLTKAVDFFAARIMQVSGINLLQNEKTSKKIVLRLGKFEEIGEEGYQLKIDSKSVTINANTPKGIIYGMQSVLQLLPAVRTNAKLSLPALDITDYPRFKWRGMHLDVSRHFFSPELVKEYIDLMSAYKFNTFHWHLTDDQGWRIEIKKYPKLTATGAWRVDRTNMIWGQRPQAVAGEAATYGGFYTQEQVKEIVAYAAGRNITIVPEIEMPGHSAAAIASYPEMSCKQQPQLPLTGGNYRGTSSNYCAGNDSVYIFLQDVLSEVIALFPSSYIHIGGDEVEKAPWRACPKCQARMKKEGLKNEEELQSYFITRIGKFIASKKRKMIGWDEILEGGLAPDARVMSWRGEAGGIQAAKMGHEVVMTPGSPVYFDHYQGDPATEPPAFGGFNPLKKVYTYEPIPASLSDSEAVYVLGAQANLWTEYITKREQVEYMVLPRMLALAEVVWSKKEDRNWINFNERLQQHFKAFDQKGLHYSKGNFLIDVRPYTQDGKLMAELSTEAFNGEVFYTMDGKEPDRYATKYTAPIRIEATSTLKAIVLVNGEKMTTRSTEQHFALHKASGKKVRYVDPPSRNYMADGPDALTDGIRGKENIRKFWHGFAGKDLVATIDLGAPTIVNSVALGCLQNYRDWIMMPQWVTFEYSLDGVEYRELAKVENKVGLNERSLVIKDFIANFSPISIRYLRVTAKALNGLPEDHPGAGKPAWIFADEVVVE